MPALFGSVAIAIVLNIIYLYLISAYTSTFAYIALGFYELILVAGIVGGAAIALSGNKAAVGVGIGMALIFLVLLLILNCMLWFKWVNFKIGIAIADASADFLASTMRIVLVSFFFGLLGYVALIVGLGAQAYLVSSVVAGTKLTG